MSSRLFGNISSKTQNNNLVYLNSGGEENVIYFRYNGFSKGEEQVGDQASFTIRFIGGKPNIDATFTNLGDGNWAIESDWFVPKN